MLWAFNGNKSLSLGPDDVRTILLCFCCCPRPAHVLPSKVPQRPLLFSQAHHVTARGRSSWTKWELSLTCASRSGSRRTPRSTPSGSPPRPLSACAPPSRHVVARHRLADPILQRSMRGVGCGCQSRDQDSQLNARAAPAPALHRPLCKLPSAQRVSKLSSRAKRAPKHKTRHVFHCKASAILGPRIGKLGVPQFLLCSRDATSCMAAAARSSPTACDMAAT
jgi:hypothetical protein